MISTTTSEIWKLDTDGFKVLAMFVLLVVEGTNGKDTGSENVDGEDDGDEHTETQIKYMLILIPGDFFQMVPPGIFFKNRKKLCWGDHFHT